MTQQRLLVITLIVAVLSSSLLLEGVRIGANLDGIADYSQGRQFVDLMRSVRAFGSTSAPYDGNPGPLGPNRWPTGDFGFIPVSTQKAGTLTGSYPFKMIGGGANVRFGLTASGGVTFPTPSYDSATNTWTGTITCGDTATQIMITIEQHDGTISSISIRRPGYPDSQVFTNEFLEALKPYSLLRFMDWASTNGNNVTRWVERTDPNDAFSKYGVPWEWMIELANTLNVDLWVNVPLLADDDYITQFATLLRDSVNSNLKIYVENSNEVWNGGFAQFQWNLDLALSEVASGNSNLNYDGSTDQYTLAFRRMGQRIKHISDIFTSVFGQSALNDRFRPVLATQIANPYVLQVAIDYLNAVYGVPGNYLYAAAGAPYFNLDYARDWTNLTKADVLKILTDTAAAAPKDNSYLKGLALAVYNRLKYVGYEGGPDTFGSGSIQAKMDASLDPQIRAICKNFIDDWYATGMDTLNWFIGDASSYDTQYGTWGATNDIFNLQAPKYQALVDASQMAQPSLTTGTLIPAVLDARDFISAPDDYKTNNPNLRNFGPGSKYEYFLRLSDPGYVTFQIKGIVTPDPGFFVEVWIDSYFVANVTLPNNGSSLTDSEITGESPLLSAGVSVVRLVFRPSPTFVGGGYMGVAVQELSVDARYQTSSASPAAVQALPSWLLTLKCFLESTLFLL